MSHASRQGSPNRKALRKKGNRRTNGKFQPTATRESPQLKRIFGALAPAGTRLGLSLGLKGLSRLQIQVNLQASRFPAICVPGPHTVLPQDHSSVQRRASKEERCLSGKAH